MAVTGWLTLNCVYLKDAANKPYHVFSPYYVKKKTPGTNGNVLFGIDILLHLI